MRSLVKISPITISILALTSISYGQDLPCKSTYKETGRCQERYEEDSNGNIHGKYISYFPSGEKEKLLTYNHGVLNGYAEIKSIAGFASGETSGHYKNGKAVGQWKTLMYISNRIEYCWMEDDKPVACDSKPIASLQTASKLLNSELRIKGMQTGIVVRAFPIMKDLSRNTPMIPDFLKLRESFRKKMSITK